MTTSRFFSPTTVVVRGRTASSALSTRAGRAILAARRQRAAQAVRLRHPGAAARTAWLTQRISPRDPTHGARAGRPLVVVHVRADEERSSLIVGFVVTSAKSSAPMDRVG